jgi:hypothetical protein
MPRLLCTIWLLALVVPRLLAAEDHSVTFYIQLVRGTKTDKPMQVNWKPIGAKLSKKLSPVFKWARYWEVTRSQVTAVKGKSVRKKITPERDLELTLLKGNKAELRLYRKGALVRKVTVSTDATMSILGGDAAEDEGWFIIVRRDKPSTE